MLLELLHAILNGQSNISVVADLAATAPLAVELERTGAQFVVTTAPLPEQLEARLASVMNRRPEVVVLGLGDAGTFLYELRPHAVAVGELSPDLLFDLIRSTARER